MNALLSNVEFVFCSFSFLLTAKSDKDTFMIIAFSHIKDTLPFALIKTKCNLIKVKLTVLPDLILNSFDHSLFLT